MVHDSCRNKSPGTFSYRREGGTARVLTSCAKNLGIGGGLVVNTL